MIPITGFPMAMMMSEDEKLANDARIEDAKKSLERQRVKNTHRCLGCGKKWVFHRGLERARGKGLCPVCYGEGD